MTPSLRKAFRGRGRPRHIFSRASRALHILGPSFPFSAAAQPELNGRMDGRSHVKQRGQGQSQRPQRMQAVEADHGQVSHAHQSPGNRAQANGSEVAREQQGGRKQVGDSQANHGAQQNQGGVVKLVEGSTRNHAADFGERAIGTDADAGIGEAEPQFSAAALDGARQGTVVNNFAANGFHAAGPRELLRANEQAAAGRARGGAPGIRNPSRRIKLEEEKNEGGDEQFFRQAAAVQLDHEGDQVITAPLGNVVQGGNRSRGMDDISVAEQEEVRSKVARGRDSLAHGPEFARPTGRQGLALKDGERGQFAHGNGCLAGDLGGAVGAGVVHKKDVQRALRRFEQGGDAAADDGGFVARRNNHGNPARLFQIRHARRNNLSDPPEAAAPQQQAAPDEGRDNRSDGEDDHRG